MAAYAALVSLLNNIHAIRKHPTLSTSLHNQPIQPLLEKIDFLLDFMEGNNYRGGSQEAQDLERQIAAAAHAAEDLIESHIVDTIHAGIEEIADPVCSLDLKQKIQDMLLEKINFLHDFMEANNYSEGSQEEQDLERKIAAAAHAVEDLIESVDSRLNQILIEANTDLVCSLDLKQSIQDMDAVMEKATEFKKKREVKEEKSTDLAVARPLKMEGGESGMVGLDAELNHLLDELTGNQSSRRIISIVGMGGSGKTTLAKNVYENKLIKETFQFRAWATVSEQHNAQEVLSQLLSNIGHKSDEPLGDKVHKALFGKKYLIIMDDIWNVKAWDEVKHFFPDNNNASRILLTTRMSNVAKDCGSSHLTMNFLDEANSWKLFCEKTFPNEDCPPELREVGEEIVKLCKGLALSIVVIGGLLLKSPKSVGYWESVAKDLKSTSNSKEKQESLDLLSLSYHHLPPHLKPCFLYVGVFKEDSHIRVSEIVNHWVAEGFIKPKESRVLEEIAEGYIKELIDRNLILVVGHEENGKFGSCGIHDLLRDLCIKLAEQEEFFHLIQGGAGGTERRLIDNQNVGWTGVNLPLTRSFIKTRMNLGENLPRRLSSIKTTKRINPSTQYKLMRVVSAFDFNSPTGYVNVNLRYIDGCMVLSGDMNKPMRKIPPSVNHSWNLQTLILESDLGYCVSLPAEFWNLRQLRHVHCIEMYIPNPPQRNREDEMLMLENLYTLKTVVNFRFSEEVCKIIPNVKNLHLSYYDGMDGYDDSLIEHLCNLNRLHKLESLELMQHLGQSLFPNRELVMKITRSFPRSLKKLSLWKYKLEWDGMTIIGSLPQLEVLQLSYIDGGNRWIPVDEQFLRLKFLRIDECDLVTWDAEASHFPVLEKLHLKYLTKLEEIPSGIGDIPTLQLINVLYCSSSAAISAVRIKEDQLDNGGQLQVQLMISRDEKEGFNQMLEEEELTINDIDLKIW